MDIRKLGALGNIHYDTNFAFESPSGVRIGKIGSLT